MTVRCSTAWTLHGFHAVVLENRELRVTILPELGGRIHSIVSKRHDREMLWHHPRVQPRAAPFRARYDDWFAGGWDEVFPNDWPVTIAGEPWADHGEVWSTPARWHIARETREIAVLVLEHRGVAIDSVFRRTLTLRLDEPRLRVAYHVANLGAAPVDVQWKLHPALPLRGGARLHLPPSDIEIDPWAAGEFADSAFAWPDAPLTNGDFRDLRELPSPVSGEVWMLYAHDLSHGRCAVSYPQENVGFGLTFDPNVLDTVCVFASFGGWRGVSTLVLEPGIGWPSRLDEAVAAGRALRLQPGAQIDTDVVMTVLGDGVDVADFEHGRGRHASI